MKNVFSRKSGSSRSSLRRLFNSLVGTDNVRMGGGDLDLPAASPPTIEALEGRTMLTVALTSLDTQPLYEGNQAHLHIAGCGPAQPCCSSCCAGCVSTWTVYFKVDYGDGKKEQYNGNSVDRDLPAHTYSQPGDYTVKADEINNLGQVINSSIVLLRFSQIISLNAVSENNGGNTIPVTNNVTEKILIHGTDLISGAAVSLGGKTIQLTRFAGGAVPAGVGIVGQAVIPGGDIELTLSIPAALGAGNWVAVFNLTGAAPGSTQAANITVTR